MRSLLQSKYYSRDLLFASPVSHHGEKKTKISQNFKGNGRKIMHTLAASVVIVIFFCSGATELSGEAGNSTLRSLRSLLLPFREDNAIR